MVKDVSINITQNLIWEVLFNHTIILMNKENTEFLDFFIA